MIQFLTLFLTGLSICFNSSGQSAKKPVIIAHRGDHTVFPENSLRAFEEAIRIKCDYVEVDLRTTKDGQLIVMHDATIDRTTTGKGSVRNLNLSDILKYQLLNPQKTKYQAAYVPLFSEVLKICKERVKIYLDFKDADVESTWKIVQSFGMDSEIVVYINQQNDYLTWRKIAPHVPLIISIPNSIRYPQELSTFLMNVDADILDGDANRYTQEMVNIVHSCNRKIWLDFQHENEGCNDWAKGVHLNIDGFQTDHPLSLMKWLSNKN